MQSHGSDQAVHVKICTINAETYIIYASNAWIIVVIYHYAEHMWKSARTALHPAGAATAAAVVAAASATTEASAAATTFAATATATAATASGRAAWRPAAAPQQQLPAAAGAAVVVAEAAEVVAVAAEAELLWGARLCRCFKFHLPEILWAFQHPWMSVQVA